MVLQKNAKIRVPIFAQLFMFVRYYAYYFLFIYLYIFFLVKCQLVQRRQPNPLMSWILPDSLKRAFNISTLTNITYIFVGTLFAGFKFYWIRQGQLCVRRNTATHLHLYSATVQCDGYTLRRRTYLVIYIFSRLLWYCCMCCILFSYLLMCNFRLFIYSLFYLFDFKERCTQFLIMTLSSENPKSFCLIVCSQDINEEYVKKNRSSGAYMSMI